MKKVPGWKKIEIVCVIIVVAFMSFLIGIYYQSRTERGSIRSLCSGWYQMKDGKRIELELPCSVTADAEGKVILYNDTLTENDRGLIVSTRGIQDIWKSGQGSVFFIIMRITSSRRTNR